MSARMTLVRCQITFSLHTYSSPNLPVGVSDAEGHPAKDSDKTAPNACTGAEDNKRADGSDDVAQNKDNEGKQLN